MDEDERQYCKVERGVDGVRRITDSIVFYRDNSWKVYAFGKKVPASSEVLTQFPDCLPSEGHAKLVHAVHKAVLCPGNPEDKFVSVCKQKGSDRGHGQVVANIDNNPVC